jgi:hypothetical protein
MNQIIAQQLEQKLLKNFEEPIFEWVNTIEGNIMFNYPNYFDRQEFKNQIENEIKMLADTNYLKEQGYKGYLYIGDFVVEVK